MSIPHAIECDTCQRAVATDESTRTETMGDHGRTRWQTLCCPHCGTRLQTVFVGGE